MGLVYYTFKNKLEPIASRPKIRLIGKTRTTLLDPEDLGRGVVGFRDRGSGGHEEREREGHKTEKRKKMR